MLIPAWHIAILWLIYSVLYFKRYFEHDRRHRYICVGKGISRLVLAGTYVYLWLWTPAPVQAQMLVRWSLMSFLIVDLVFMVQEEFMKRMAVKQ